MSPPKRSRRWRSILAIALLAAGFSGIATAPSDADTPVHQILSSVSDAAGGLFTATNHLVDDRDQDTGQFLVVWAGDVNASDTTAHGLVDTALGLVPPNLPRLENILLPDVLPGQDFLAVIDADPDSSRYGQVVNTVTVGPLVEHEPHHMQYVWHKGQNIYAGSLYLDTTFVFDATELPLLKLTGVNIPTDTLCGSVPDAYWVLNDGTAYGTYMGGPDVPGPCLYTNGETRIGNGFAGTPGSLVRIDKDGDTLSEVPADTNTPVDRDPVRCPGLVPITTLVSPSCANPHGIQVREDLNVLITGDYAEPINVPASVAISPANPNFFRDTVRIWDISDRDDAKVVSVTALPDGPRRERNPGHEEPKGIMEVTVTNQPHNKGAFAESMCGGAIYYTPDITDPTPEWREVFDVTTASKEIIPLVGEGGGCGGGGWVQTSGDDRYLYHAVIGRGPGSLGEADTGTAKMVFALDIQELLAAGTGFECNIDTLAEVYDGGAEADCPRLVDALEIPDNTSGGPHWGTLDNFEKQPDGTYREVRAQKRIAVSNYFVALSGVDGNHKVNMLDIADDGTLSFDTKFRDENEGTVGIDFNRTVWPHGRTGAAKPHSSLFVVRDALLPADSAATGPDPGAVQAAGAGSATKASVEIATSDIPVVTAPAEVPTNGDLTEVAATPVSTSSDARELLPAVAIGLAAVLIAATGASTVLAARARRRSVRA
ncbi:MAG: selenium-binding family protein [Actinomycetota bacterium]|nr:selenium-binding family protein [Actinomycetota bacterium]